MEFGGKGGFWVMSFVLLVKIFVTEKVASAGGQEGGWGGGVDEPPADATVR